ncbi:hypothetical protein B9479_000077 [Cryptococcus floricola]|uniref:Early meiotic induction protein 1 n=1 Tax=Cryptococcus floricola TaxID=2591691 RepID=A0A5D3B7V3_9TREE|nr:hypothetical protein B9479_000077 [Cryptococcus floricola]
MRVPFFSPAPPSSTESSEAGPSTPTPAFTPAASAATAPVVNRFEHMLADETSIQEAQYPTYDEVPGCMRLLDEFLMCYALVPQLRSFYRRGEMSDCTWKFQDFKYCMSLKSSDPEEKRQLWIKRRAEWWAQRRLNRSSEDVWDLRTERLDNFPPLAPEDVSSDTTTA